MESTWKRYADRMGVEIISIKRAGWFQRSFSINHYLVTARYKNRTFKLTAWAGRYNSSLDNIYYSVTDQIEDLIESENFNAAIKRFAVSEKAE